MDLKDWLGLGGLLVLVLSLICLCAFVRTTLKKGQQDFMELAAVDPYQHSDHMRERYTVCQTAVSDSMTLSLTEKNLANVTNYSRPITFGGSEIGGSEINGLQQARGSDCGESALEPAWSSDISHLQQARGSVCGRSAIEPVASCPDDGGQRSSDFNDELIDGSESMLGI